MLIVDSQIHIWQNGKMSSQHRQIPTYSIEDALAEMAAAGVDCAVLHPPSSLGEAVNTYAVEASGHGSRVTQGLDAKASSFTARMLIPVVQGRLEKKVTDDLERLRELLGG